MKTPAAKRSKLNGTKTPWTQAEEKKSDLLKRLQEAEQQQDFFSGLYRQYTTNLLKLVIYVRALLNNERARQYLQEHHTGQLELAPRPRGGGDSCGKLGCARPATAAAQSGEDT